MTADQHASRGGAKGEVRVVEPDRVQRTIARQSAEARATIPHLELSAEVAIDASLAVCERERCSITAILVRACALALRDVPQANAAYRDGRFELYSRINIGVTVATGAAYTIPTVFDCDRKPLGDLSDEIATLAQRARAGKLTAPELSGATFTVSNPGAIGVERATPVIVPPQAAAIAAGKVRQIPVVRDGAIVPGSSMPIALACDHRILYGSQAAQFLNRIQTQLEEAAL